MSFDELAELNKTLMTNTSVFQLQITITISITNTELIQRDFVSLAD